MIVLVSKEINQLKGRKENNGHGYHTVNYYRDTFSISNWNTIDD
jgi:hypothetical protein